MELFITILFLAIFTYAGIEDAKKRSVSDIPTICAWFLAAMTCNLETLVFFFIGTWAVVTIIEKLFKFAYVNATSGIEPIDEKQSQHPPAEIRLDVYRIDWDVDADPPCFFGWGDVLWFPVFVAFSTQLVSLTVTLSFLAAMCVVGQIYLRVSRDECGLPLVLVLAAGVLCIAVFSVL